MVGESRRNRLSIAAILALGMILAHRRFASAQEQAAPPATAPTTQTATTESNLYPGLKFAVGPKEGREVVLANLRKYAGRPRGPDAADVEKATADAPMAVYRVTAADIANGKGFETAKAGEGFEYIVDASDRAIAAILVKVDETGKARMSTMAFAPQAQTYRNALAQVAAAESIRAGSFEVRLVLASGLLGSGTSQFLWLKSDAGGTDFVYPMSPNPYLRAPGGFQLDKLYTAEDFLNGVRPIAQRRQALPAQGPRGR